MDEQSVYLHLDGGCSSLGWHRALAASVAPFGMRGPEQCLVRIIDAHEGQFHQPTPITMLVTYSSSLYRNLSQIPFSHTEPNLEFLLLIPYSILSFIFPILGQ